MPWVARRCPCRSLPHRGMTEHRRVVRSADHPMPAESSVRSVCSPPMNTKALAAGPLTGCASYGKPSSTWSAACRAIAGCRTRARAARCAGQERLSDRLAIRRVEEFSRTCGTGRLAGGALFWSDFLYDDHGATGVLVDVPIAGLAPPRGTYVYPAGPTSTTEAAMWPHGRLRENVMPRNGTTSGGEPAVWCLV